MGESFGQRGGGRRGSAVYSSLGMYEVPQAAEPGSEFPLVLSGAAGTRVRDADGNRYIDLTSFFGACLAGHRNRAVLTAARHAMGHLVHGMGDVYPDESRAKLLKRIAGLMPEPGYRGLLSLNGSDAVDTALKFAAAYSGKGGIIAFEGAYHGLSGAALEVTWRDTFRKPFDTSLSGRAVFAPWPAADGSDLDEVLEKVRRLALTPVRNRWGIEIGTPGALIVEPLQGRGGIRVAPQGFLRGLAGICRETGVVFITDEIYSGIFRTGIFLAGDTEGVTPDIVCLGKALGCGFPVSAAMMRPAIATAVQRDDGEAVHTSTFMGWPVSCAAALAGLNELERMMPAAGAALIEATVRAAVEKWMSRFGFVSGLRGRGAMLGVEISGPGAPGIVMSVVREARQLGLIVLPEGSGPDVIALTPPLSTTPEDLATGLRLLGRAIEKVHP